MIGEFAFHLTGTHRAGVLHLGNAVAQNPACIVHPKGQFSRFLSGTDTVESEEHDFSKGTKARIDKFQRACWREAGKHPGKKWGHQTHTDHIGKLLDPPGSASSAVDTGWQRQRGGFDAIDYFICRCIRVPTIFIVRDGRATIPALVEKDQVPVQVAVARWKFGIHVLRRVLNFVEKCHVVRLEDMMEAPKETTMEICGFLGIQYVEEMIKGLTAPNSIQLYKEFNLPPATLESRAKDGGWLSDIEEELQTLGYAS